MSKTPAASGDTGRHPGVHRDGLAHRSPGGSGGHPCQGLYHRGVGRRPKVAMIATHYQIDFSEHYLADYMATRGIGFLGWNTRFRGYESSFLLDHALVDIGVGVRWLREVQGVETVVLLGNSGGGSLMAAYQAQAVEPHVTPLEGMRPAAGLGELPAADGYIASAAHPGRPDVLTAWMDASVVDENDALGNRSRPRPVQCEERAALHAMNSSPATGRHRSPATTRSPTGRNRTEAGPCSGFLRPPVHGAAHLGRSQHGRSHAGADEATANMCYAGVPAKANRSAHGIAAACTLRNWFGMWSLRHAQTRAEAASGPHRLPGAGDQRRAGHRRLPVGRPAHLRRTRSSDKTQRAIDTDHYFTTPGARSEKADTIARWIAKRWR